MTALPLDLVLIARADERAPASPHVSETDEIARYHKRMVRIYGTLDGWARYFSDKPRYATALSLIVVELEHEVFTPQGWPSAAAWIEAWPGTVAGALEYMQAQEDRVRVALWQAATDGHWCMFFDSIALTFGWPEDPAEPNREARRRAAKDRPPRVK